MDLRNLILFERCSGRLSDLRFDSQLLESYYKQCSFSQGLKRFRMAITYLALMSFVWALFMIFVRTTNSEIYLGFLIASIVSSVSLYLLSYLSKRYPTHMPILYILSAVVYAVLFLVSFASNPPKLNIFFSYSLVIQLVLIIYALYPMHLWQVLSITIPLSIVHIIMNIIIYDVISYQLVLVQFFGHFCIHLVGFVLLLMSQVRRRSTFLRLGHSCLMRQVLKKEQKIRDDMICSLMPKKLADQVLKDQNQDQNQNDKSKNMMEEDLMAKKKKKKRCIASFIGHGKGVHNHNFNESVDYFDSEEDLNEQTRKMSAVKSGENGQGDVDLEAMEVPMALGIKNEQAVKFRQFHVDLMENVSILFADIVGFTKMSSNKTASHLVFLLNDLFGRFDRLCEMTGCEKIATLGDCYYCVCGCPEAVKDHAERTVEMGRAMCLAIQQFDEDHSEEVNMRVGVHTGKVLSGIVGTKRFKFDVWSHDVTLANEMESSGEAGTVHISEATLAFVSDIYEVVEGEDLEDIRKEKVLVEFFDKEEQCYAIKHTKDEGRIRTFFVKRRFDNKEAVKLPRIDVGASTTPKNEDTVTVETILETEPLNPIQTISKKRNDSDLLHALKEFNSDVNEVFSYPSISRLSLNFYNKNLEKYYRRIALRKIKTNALITWATPKMSQLINTISFSLYFLITLISCLIGFPSIWNFESSSLWFLSIAILGIILTAFILIVVITDFNQSIEIAKQNNANRKVKLLCCSRMFAKFFSWYPRNIIGSILIILPSALILSNFNSCLFSIKDSSQNNLSPAGYKAILGIFFSFMLYDVTLFTMFSFWTKSLTATVISIIALVLIHTSKYCDGFLSDLSFHFNDTLEHVKPNNTLLVFKTDPQWSVPASNELTKWEYTLIIILHLVLIWILNREFEISARNSFEKDSEARQAKNQISKEKLQADWLLGNIIPSYIMEDLSKTQKYSQHIPDAAVIFATIANFSEFYDEQYQGGQEMLRVLNEIFADFEHLLTSKKYKDIEKIKTIGACFMAASGLNLIEREKNKDPNAHLYALMDFARDLIRTMDEFNAQMFSFKFELKIGYNIGEVTAGVIGTTKLLYDIWGDTVNVASRMYSTGQKGKIQVTENISNRLSEKYKFEYRGEVFVKGKGDMKTYHLVES